PTRTREPSTPSIVPRNWATTPIDTWPGMIGYGTPASRPCQRWTSVPQISEYVVRNSAEPASSAGSGNSRISTGTRGAGITAARIDGIDAAKIPHMPLFEYECRACGHHFEHLTRDGRTPACPSCASGELQKLLSVFAVGANGGGQSASGQGPAPCGTCGDPRGPGSCGM